MIEFENYKDNIEIKRHRKSVNVNEAASYSGEIDILKKYKDKESDERKRPLAAAIVGINNTIAPLPNTPDFNTWTDIDTQELFLRSKPTCYLILCKPGADAYNLGEAISKKYNCIHLSPRIIIDDELAQKSPTGTCLDFNMKHKKAITFETFFKMIKVKVESLVIEHRGYVITGFPILTCSRSLHYLVNTLHGEESVSVVGDILFDMIANLNKKKKKKIHVPTDSPITSMTSDIELPGEDDDVEEEPEPEENLGEEEEELKVELPKFLLDPCSNVIHPTKAYYSTKKIVSLKQLEDLFSLKLKPNIVIYLNCPDKTLILKNSHRYFDYQRQNYTFDPFPSITTTEIRWPPQYVTHDETNLFENHSFNPKYAVRQPNNFEPKSIEQMCNYNRDVLPFLEKKLKEFDPKHVIKVDARFSLQEMFHEVSERLLIMGITPIIIPEPLYMEDVPEEMDEFWEMVEKQSVISSGPTTFNRHASPWFNRCPVELKKRICKKGNPKLAIAFLNHVYLTASLDNFISFYKNPRPYLKLKYLKPTCRMIVIGTMLSGKTMIAECLSWLFDTPVINYNDILQIEITKKYDVYTKTILSEIIATIEDDRLVKWQNAEMERLASLDAWSQSKIVELKKYIPLLKEYSVQQQKIKVSKKRRSGDEEIDEEDEETPPIDTAFMNKYNTMRSILSFLPILNDINECQKALSIDIISKYAPQEIKTPKKMPSLPVMGDEDVTAAITAYIEANDLQKEIYPTTEEVMNVITNIISSIDAQHQEHTNMDEMYGTYIIDGVPSEVEYWSILAESNLLPDYTIALVENREIEPELIEYYKTVKSCAKHSEERFILANDPLINIKLKSQKPPSDSKNLVKHIVNDLVEGSIVESILDEKADESIDVPETEPWISFGEKVEKFKEDWDTVKIKLEDDNKCFIDVELETKSDIKIVEEVLLKLRKCYYLACISNEDEEVEEQDDENKIPKDMITYNNPVHFGETGMYCPISYYTHGVLWEGKPEFSVKFDSKLYRLSKEENLEPFQNDVTKYQSYSKPFKTLPPLRICVIGCIGSGRTTVSKLLAKELGLMHIDFSEILNDMLMPKHFKKVGLRYENTFTDVPIDDEAVVEFQMDEGNENLISDIMSSETELRKMLNNYFERGSQILPQLMQILITKLWFQDPFVKTGFILDGYPKLPTDVEDMITCYCIPDLIIEIESSSEKTLERLAPKMFKTWKMQLNEAKEKSRVKLKKEKKEWLDFLTKNIVAKLICDEILDNIFLSSEPIKGLSVESVLIDANPSGSVIDSNLFNTLNEMIQEFPEPVDQSEWERADDARERIDARLEAIYESDNENIESMKDLLLEQRIKTVSINGNKSLTKVTRLALSKVKDLRNRNKSFFEETFVVSPEIAEALLLSGICILSNRFNRMCPVHIFENPNEIMSIYKISQRKNTVFPVIHRSYLYFMYGKENLKKFRSNPLRYVTDKNIEQFEQYPLRISVIGAPKSGKSTLSANLAKRYGLLCLSKGIAVRDVLNKKHWTELATNMTIALTAGECIRTELVMKAVKMMAMNHQIITNGFVFDGFPETASEAMVLVKDGLYPDIILDISADTEYVEENSQKEIYYDLLKRKPPYSRPFIENRYKKWQEQKYSIREWIDSDYQNVYNLDGNKSKWDCLDQTVKIINDFCMKVHHYLTHVKTDIVLVDFLCISNADFEHRMSGYKHMCPLCYLTHNLKQNGNPVIKKGIVQYQDKFYWICQDHIDTVLKNPLYLTAQIVHDIPELPLIVKTVNMALVYEKGICIVTYAEHLPAQNLVVGTVKYAASYKGNRYLFCSKTCHDKFLAKPHLYYDITVFRNASVSKPLTVKGLPDIGYLEQTVGIMITEACVSVTIHRPKYPGLTYQISALLYIALFLKTHNPKISEDSMEMYRKASKIFNARCKLIPHVGLFLRSMDNPFASYPKCCGVESKAEIIGKPSSHSEISTRRSLTYSDTFQ